MKTDGESAPTWPLCAALYFLGGFVVTESPKDETSRTRDASSPKSVQEQLWLGATWPATAGMMGIFHQDPMACVFWPSARPMSPGA